MEEKVEREKRGTQVKKKTLTVRVSPAARGREAALGPLDGSLQVAHNAAVVGAHVTRRPEIVPRTPRGVGYCSTPVTVLNQNGLPSPIKQAGIQVQVALGAAPKMREVR